MRYFSFFLLLLSCSSQVFSQRSKFDVSIVLDSNIDETKIFCQYNNGRGEIDVKGGFANKVLNVRGKFYSKFLVFHIEYKTNHQSYDKEYFIGSRPAKIELGFLSSETADNVTTVLAENVIPAYDTIANEFYKNFALFRVNEGKAVADFFEKHRGEVFRNDSLREINKVLFKKLNARAILFLRKDPGNYFSFWYFRDQVIAPSLTFFAKDRGYLKNLLDSMKSIYPKKYIKSIEGRAITNKIQNLININEPPNVNTIAPVFKFTDSNGRKVNLSDCKGKYVLLDFWASWCGPCIRDLPFVKQLREEYPKNKLEIIGISDDRDISILKKAILKYQIPWENFIDKNKRVSNSFGVRAIPVKILINKNGIIVYDSRGNENKAKLVELLNSM